MIYTIVLFELFHIYLRLKSRTFSNKNKNYVKFTVVSHQLNAYFKKWVVHVKMYIISQRWHTLRYNLSLIYQIHTSIVPHQTSIIIAEDIILPQLCLPRISKALILFKLVLFFVKYCNKIIYHHKYTVSRFYFILRC